MDIFSKLYDDLKKLVLNISRKDLKLGKRIRIIVIVIIILFIIIPILINFFSILELKQYISVLSMVSEINLNDSPNTIKDEYAKLENYISNYSLPITDFKNSVIELIRRLFINSINIKNINLNKYITYIGFEFKADVFLKIFVWNIIPLSIMSLFVSFFSEKGKFPKAVSVVLSCLGYMAISAVYSTLIACVLSCLCFAIILSVDFTQTTLSIISILLPIFAVIISVKKSKKSS